MSDCSNWRGDQIKATVEQEFRERWSEDSGAWSVRARQPERMLRVIAETTERVDVFRTCRVRTCLSLSVNKIHPSLHEPTLSASFLPYELRYTAIFVLFLHLFLNHISLCNEILILVTVLLESEPQYIFPIYELSVSHLVVCVLSNKHLLLALQPSSAFLSLLCLYRLLLENTKFVGPI